jgi:hypothetical protein
MGLDATAHDIVHYEAVNDDEAKAAGRGGATPQEPHEPPLRRG